MGPARARSLCGRLRANWTYAELAEHLKQEQGIQVSRPAVCDFCHRHGIRPYRPTYRLLRGDPDKQRVSHQQIQDLKKAATDKLILLSQDEARFPLVPTLVRTLGCKGHQPVVGSWDNKDLVYAFASSGPRPLRYRAPATSLPQRAPAPATAAIACSYRPAHRFFKLTRIGAGIRQHVCGENQLRRVLRSENSSARAKKEMPQFAGYEKKAPNRVIPVVRLDS